MSLQGKCKNDQQGHEKVLNITNNQGDVYETIIWYLVHLLKSKKQTSAVEDVGERECLCAAGENVN